VGCAMSVTLEVLSLTSSVSSAWSDVVIAETWREVGRALACTFRRRTASLRRLKGTDVVNVRRYRAVNGAIES
jgi:hypothetical protein